MSTDQNARENVLKLNKFDVLIDMKKKISIEKYKQFDKAIMVLIQSH